MDEKIKFSDWQKLDLRVGEIKTVEKVPDTDNLYNLEVDLGDNTQIVVSGLVPYYTEEQLQNKKIILFTNLEPKTIRGIESKGMVLAATTKDKDGEWIKVKLLQPDDDIELGARIS